MSRLPVAVLAGGLATRLGTLTRETPKCLIDVAGRPFVHHQLCQLRSQGVRRVTFCVGHLGEQIVDVVGDGSRYGMEVDYSFDGPRLLGTAGAIKRALPLLGEAFFVLYGDSFLECDYAAVQHAYEAAGKSALMTVFHNQGRWDTSNVEFRGGELLAFDKFHPTAEMNYIDYGLGIFSRQAFDLVAEHAPDDLALVYRRLLDRGELAGFEVAERFHEIGSVAGLEETRRHLAGRAGPGNG